MAIHMGSESGASSREHGDDDDSSPSDPAPATSLEDSTSRWGDPGRAIALSDGVFAIIITLLVLDLLLPEGEPGHLLTRLLDRWPAYVAYLATYLLIGVVWLTHVSAFGHVRQMDYRLQWCNLAILFTTGLLPFPTAVLAQAMSSGNLADERVAVGLYGVIGALTTLSWLLFYQYLSRHPALLVRIPRHAYFSGERAAIGSVLYLVGALCGVILSPLLALAIFVGFPIFFAFSMVGLAKGLGGRGAT
jgi:uncharacterized membrane protein